MSNIHIPHGPTIRFYFDSHTLLNLSWYTYLENGRGVERFLAIKLTLLFFVLEPIFNLGQTKEYKAEQARLAARELQWEQERLQGGFKKVGGA